MAWLSRLFKRRPAIDVGFPTDGVLPTVRFDASRVTSEVETEIRNWLIEIPELRMAEFESIFRAAVTSVRRGGDLHVLHRALVEIGGLPKRRASEVALLVNNRATRLMERKRQLGLGITQAIWMHSGAPCELDAKRPTGQGAAHYKCDGEIYDIEYGLLIDGKRTWPGFEPGCKCFSKSVIPGFS